MNIDQIIALVKWNKNLNEDDKNIWITLVPTLTENELEQLSRILNNEQTKLNNLAKKANSLWLKIHNNWTKNARKKSEEENKIKENDQLADLLRQIQNT